MSDLTTTKGVFNNMKFTVASIGQVVDIQPIEGADRIESVSVVCNDYGKWHTVAQRGVWKIGDLCVTYLMDAMPVITDDLKFLEKTDGIVRVSRVKGTLSECVIVPVPESLGEVTVGQDVMEALGVKKYFKPLPTNSDIVGDFHPIVPKTYEPMYQRVPLMLEALKGQPYYITMKYDGTSGAVLNDNGTVRIYSRNYEVNPKGVWGDVLGRFFTGIPEGIAIQFELYGEGIPPNPLGISGKDIAVFSIYSLFARQYQAYADVIWTCRAMNLPLVKLVEAGNAFDHSEESLLRLASGKYPSGKPMEGIVVRSATEMLVGGERLSFKVINPDYKD